MPRRKREPRADEGDDVRGRVLAAAEEMLSTGDLASLSMREVARKAGVSHQAPYHYFANRQAILAALAEHGFQVLGADLERALATGAGTAAERLAAAGRAYVTFAFQNQALFRVMFRPDFVDIESYPSAKAAGDRCFEVLPRLIEACVDEGLDPRPSELSLVVLAWSVAHGLACLFLDGPLDLKLSERAPQRDALVRDVMSAMRAMVESRSKPGAAPKRRTRETPPRRSRTA